jgi:hypothetical protein
MHSKALWFVLPVVLPFVPVPVSWQWRFLGDESNAQSFLSTAWQVQAAAVGLSLAVAVFAMQAVVADRWRPTPREIARATQADAVLSLGVASILVTGVAVAGLGRGGAGGWSGSVAVTVAALSLGSVLPLWMTSVSAVAGGKLRTIRLREITRAVEQSVDQDVHERIALRALTEFLERSGTEFSMLDLGSRKGVPVTADRTGRVSDINLRRLGRVLDDHSAKVKLRGYLGLACGDDSILARVVDDPKVSVRVRKAFKLRRNRVDDVGVGFKLLHHLATQALRDGDALAYEEVRSAYRSLLKIYPEVWSRFGQRFDSDTAQQVNPFMLPVLSEVQRNLTRQVLVAADGPNIELATEAAWLPGLVALDAIPLGADALFTAMLDVVVSAHHQLVSRGAPSAIVKQLRDVVVSSIEYGPVPVVKSSDVTIQRRTEAADVVKLGYKRLASLAKQLLDLDMPDELGRLLGAWDEYLRFFAPDQVADSARWRLDALQQQGGSNPELLAEVADLESQVTLRRALDDTHSGLLLELVGWAVHKTRAAGGAPSAAAQRILAAVPGDLDRILELPQLDGFERSLTDWIMFDRPDDMTVGTIDSFGPVLDAIALAAIRSADVQQPPTLAATARLNELEDRLVQHINEMVGLWAFDSIAPRGDQHERARVVSEAIRDAARRYRLQREFDVIEKSLDPRQVSAFVDKVRDTFLARRVVPRWLGTAYTSVPRDEGQRPEVMGCNETLAREWFQDDAKMDITSIAVQAGREHARSEVRTAILQLNAASPVEHEGDARSAAQAGVQLLKDSGAEPNVVFVPRHPQNWRMFKREQLDPAYRERNTTIQVPEAFPSVGSIDGVDVFETELLPKNRVVVADLRRALRWAATAVQPENEELVIAVHDGPDLEQALRQAEDDPTFFRRAEENDAETRARRAAATVNLRTRTCAYVAIDDATSVVAFTLTKPAHDGTPPSVTDDELT